MTDYLQPLFFAGQILFLYFISRVTVQEVFYFFAHFTRNQKVIFSLVSTVFFIGTVLHEMAHFIMAIALMLRVRDIKIFPEWEGNSIKLGRVLYEKKDFVRGIIVGIAPIFAGIYFFWLIAYWGSMASTNIFLMPVIIYLMFVISTTMFSSKQDLIDIVFIVPVIVMGAVILYVLNIPVLPVILNFLPHLSPALLLINHYLLYSVLIHIGLLVLFKSIRHFKRR